MASGQIRYPLYSTLNVNIKKKDMPRTKKIELVGKLNKMTKTQHEAVLMLICEHARCVENYSFSKPNFSLPYKASIVKQDAKFDLESLPPELKWILYKFSQVCEKLA